MLKRLLSLGRGAAVPHRKNTEEQATEQMPLPKTIKISMQQHIGAPCNPLVKKGDLVKVGQLVGEANGFVSSPVHSGVSGKVIGIEPVLSSTGKLVDAVVIEPDGLQTLSEEVMLPEVTNRESFLQAVKKSGLVGLGGAGFPTSIKLSPKDPADIDRLLINAAECEPYITSDNREMLENSEDILSGIAAVQKYLGIPKALIGIERNKPQAMDLLFGLTQGNDAIDVFALPSRYPQGAEKVLIETMLGREVPAGGFPADVGVLVMNVTTVAELGRYLATGLPLTTKRLTIDGGAVSKPQNVKVVLGTSVSDIIEFCGGYKTSPAKLLLGGPMMGTALPNDTYPIAKQNNAILALTPEEAALPKPNPCIRCGRCIHACPMRLSPVEANEAYESKDVALLKTLHADVCISCGVCSFVCPAGRYVSQNASLARLYLLQEVKKENGT